MNSLLVQEASMEIRFGVGICTRCDVDVSDGDWVALDSSTVKRRSLPGNVCMIPHRKVHNSQIFTTGNWGVRTCIPETR